MTTIENKVKRDLTQMIFSAKVFREYPAHYKLSSCQTYSYNQIIREYMMRCIMVFIFHKATDQNVFYEHK